MDILADTGFLVAYIAKNDAAHKEAVQQLQRMVSARLHTTWEVMTEACHMLKMPGRSELLSFAEAFPLEIHATQTADLQAISAYMTKYKNASRGKGPDLADVSLVFLAERLGTVDIFTVDENDFSTYKTRKGKAFNILWGRKH